MKQYALLGFGIVQLHEYIIKNELKSGQLVEILKTTLNEDLKLYMYYQKHRFVQPKIRQFVDLAIQNF